MHQDKEINQDVDQHQEEDSEETDGWEDDDEEEPRTLAMYFSLGTPFVSSVFKGLFTPKNSVKKTTADTLPPSQP